mmetsp:Transcript_3285/g.7677  ORF Transcript_3285/g.7677 Transcript_3285/m.7677 type:complete len:224 (+) Transcript_3285:856-1527(+)
MAFALGPLRCRMWRMNPLLFTFMKNPSEVPTPSLASAALAVVASLVSTRPVNSPTMYTPPSGAKATSCTVAVAPVEPARSPTVQSTCSSLVAPSRTLDLATKALWSVLAAVRLFPHAVAMLPLPLSSCACCCAVDSAYVNTPLKLPPRYEHVWFTPHVKAATALTLTLSDVSATFPNIIPQLGSIATAAHGATAASAATITTRGESGDARALQDLVMAAGACA